MVDHHNEHNEYYYYYFQLYANSPDAHQPASGSKRFIMMIFIISVPPPMFLLYKCLFFCVFVKFVVEETQWEYEQRESMRENEKMLSRITSFHVNADLNVMMVVCVCVQCNARHAAYTPTFHSCFIHPETQSASLYISLSCMDILHSCTFHFISLEWKCKYAKVDTQLLEYMPNIVFAVVVVL